MKFHRLKGQRTEVYDFNHRESGDAFPALLVSMEIEAKNKDVVMETIFRRLSDSLHTFW